MKKRTHWTISALKDFETCPAKYRYGYLLDADDWRELGYIVGIRTESPQMLRGTEIHNTCENFLKGKGKLHREIGPEWAALIGDLKKAKATAEEQWEFEEGWHPKAKKGDLWLRMKIDAHLLPEKNQLRVIDYKTGKPYHSNIEQVEVYAIGGFAKFDDVDTIHAELWYLDYAPKPQTKVIHRAQVSNLARKWEIRAGRLTGAVKFPARRNKFCDWCAFNAKKGGPCTPP